VGQFEAGFFAFLFAIELLNPSIRAAAFQGRDSCSILRSAIRILLVDDYAFFRQFGVELLKERPELQVAGEASDGLEALQRAVELRPDLILVDIGLWCSPSFGPKFSLLKVDRCLQYIIASHFMVRRLSHAISGCPLSAYVGSGGLLCAFLVGDGNVALSYLRSIRIGLRSVHGSKGRIAEQ